MNFRKFEVFKMEPSELNNVIDQLDRDTSQTIHKARPPFSHLLRSTTKSTQVSTTFHILYLFISL